VAVKRAGLRLTREPNDMRLFRISCAIISVQRVRMTPAVPALQTRMDLAEGRGGERDRI
jgi:hypothetical protein